MPAPHPFRQFTVLVKNVGQADITLPEIGGYVLHPDVEIDMCSPDLPSGHYDDPSAVMRALLELPLTVLYQERVAGHLTHRILPTAAHD